MFSVMRSAINSASENLNSFVTHVFTCRGSNAIFLRDNPKYQKQVFMCSMTFCFQELFSNQSNLYSEKLGPNFDLAIEIDDTPVPEEPHTLESFSLQHFNTLPKRTLSKALANSLRKRERDFPWSYSKVGRKNIYCL